MVRIVHDGRRYMLEGHRREGSFLDVLKWQMVGNRARWPRRVRNRSFPPPPRRVDGDALKATWIGHSTVLLQTRGLNILTDPFLSSRASPVPFAGPRRVRPAALKAETLPPIDLILLSHNHYDHMDLPALRRLARRHQAHVVTPHGNARWVISASPAFTIDELGWGGMVEHKGLRVHLTPALHWSKRGLFDANTALWGAFVVETPGGFLYFAADTGFGSGSTFADVRQRFGAPRLSLLPIGAYEPRWFMHPQHMNPDEAVKAHKLLGARASLAIHHGTIQLTDEAIDAPVAALTDALRQHSVDPASFLVPDAGETLDID
ncbi:MAG: MBL fold metallo-hydrolase [Aestuariivirga sp.]|uniref:MBL fold metallo-hydrolase n=1 Tax=Aestuariivirga sp. TaxID=2650926 RepID=UPI0025C223BF|nr:MBL fold metallo-hydrolase [Aestuariivirga sp.]MCA3560365.1 MBL fold metallo-hydrolase [Aestuariivirga sp.]